MKLCLFILACLLAPLTVTGADYYVATTGSDTSGCGALVSPCASIYYVSTHMTFHGGDVVHVAAGTYTGSASEITQGSDTTTPVVFQGENSSFGGAVDCAQLAADGTAVSGTSCPKITGEFDVYNSSTPPPYVTVQGFEVTGSTTYHLLYMGGTHGLAKWNWVHDSTITTCSSGGGDGINLYSTGNTVPGYNSAVSNLIYNIASNCTGSNGTYYHGIYISCEYCSAYNNIVFGNTGWGIQAFASASPANVEYVTISDNTVFNNTSGGIVYGSDYASNAYQGNATFRNNIVANNGGYAYTETCGAAGSCGGGDVYSNSDVWGNSNGGYNLVSGTPSTTDQTGTNGNTFVNYVGDETGDYHLASGASAIGNGTSTDAFATDFDGISRPHGGSYDIGAYEYSGSIGESISALWSLIP